MTTSLVLDTTQHLLPVPVRYVVPSTATSPMTFEAEIDIRRGEKQWLTYAYATQSAHLPLVLAWLAGQPTVALDLETSGLDPLQDRIATLQLGALGHPSGISAWVIDVRGCDPDALEPLWAWCEGKTATKLGQNIGFEYRFLRQAYGVRCRKLADTQVAELVLRAGLFTSKAKRATTGERTAYKLTSMAALMERYVGVTIDKDTDLRTSFYSTPVGKHTVRQIIYAASDVIYPFVIAAAQKPLIAERELTSIVKLEMELIPVLHEMEHRGMRLDQTAWRTLWQEAVAERSKYERQLDDLLRPCTEQPDLFACVTGPTRPIYPKKNTELNYGSSEQVKWAIRAYCEYTRWPLEIVTDLKRLHALKKQYGQWHLDMQQGRPGVEPSIEQVPDHVVPEDEYCLLLDADKITLTLRKVRKQLPAELVDALLGFSKYDQRATAFGKEWLVQNVNKRTGRIHTTIHQAITTTGRLSSQPNLQNIPSDPRYRQCFIPADGFAFVIADYSQQEPRLLAQVSKDPVYLGTYARHDDLYLSVAEAMIGHRPDKSTEDGKLERQVFKAIVLAMAYRSGAPKLRDQLTLGLADAVMAGKVDAPTLEYAQQMHRRFFEVHERVKEFQDRCSEGANPRGERVQKYYDELVGDFVTHVRAPCGRVRFFPPDAKNTYTEAANAPIQGGSATMTKAAACLIQQMIDRNGWQDQAFIVNLVHDEIVCEVHQAIAEEFAPQMKALMEEAGRFYCPDVPIVAEFPKGTNGVVSCWLKEA